MEILLDYYLSLILKYLLFYLNSRSEIVSFQIFQIQQETKTKVAEMFRESTLNRAKSASKIHGKWVQQMMA